MLGTLRRGHPRLVADDARFARIRELVRTDPVARKWFACLLEQVEKIMGEPIVSYEIPDGKRLLAMSRRLVKRIYAVGMAWHITREPAMLARGWAELEATAAFPDWNPSHFLDTAEMTAGVAIGYDWLYDELGDAQRRILEAAILRHGLEPGLRSYEGRSDYGWWVTKHNNWNQVCNGGMIAGALAIADKEPELAATIVRHAVASLPIAMRSFAPDGGWFEGPGYWSYAMQYNALAIACLDSALGTDFGLAHSEGFDRAADFYIQMAGATGRCFNYADASVAPVQHPALFWLASKFNRPDWARYQLRYGVPCAESLLFYDPSFISSEPDVDARVVAYFRGVEVASARTRWDDEQALFVGVKAGRNGVNHDNLDLGSFIFEALGERWIIDLGPDDYNLPGYFGAKRYTYYRTRAEGHNTLVLNPGRCEPDQDTKAFCEIPKAERVDGVSVITTDLTPAYRGHGARRVERTFMLVDRALTITDTIELDGPGEVWEFFHTTAAVCLAENERGAVLTIGDKTLRVSVESPAHAKLSVSDARPLPGSPDPEGQNPNNGAALLNATKEFRIVRIGAIPCWGEPDPDKAIRKLAIHLEGITSATIRVVMQPV